jgi:hypothetical protein
MKGNTHNRYVILACILFCAAVAQAQDTPKPEPQKPLTPLGTDDGSSQAGGKAEVPYSEPEPAVLPDSRPITGFESLSLGMKAANRNVLLPSFTVSTAIQSSPYQGSQANTIGIESTTTLAGRLAMNRTTQLTSLTLDYTAGGSFSSDPNQGSSALQSLNITDSLRRGRWSFTVGDRLFYASSSPFGYGGLGGIGNYGVGLNDGGSGFRPGVSPDQSILLSGTPQISNTAVFQTSYALTHRSYFTAGVSYGLLNILGGGLLNNSDVSFQTGYGYMASRHDTIGISYGYSRFMYSGSVPASQGHVVQFTYARQITGRLSLVAGGGPAYQIYNSPLLGPSNVLSWAASGSLSYALGYLSTSLNYSHGQSGGSGIFPGAETDSLTASAARAITRNWSGSISAGFGKSSALQQTSAAANLKSPESFYAVATASRKIFQRGSLSLSYGISRQLNLGVVCSLPICQVGALSQTGTIGYSWALRPIILE